MKATLFRLAAESGVEVDNVFELARMMRLPGSVNHKATPVPVEIIFSDWHRTYTARDFDIVLVSYHLPPRVRSISTPGGQVRRGSSRWRERDEFNRLHSVHDLLLTGWWLGEDP